MPTGLIGSGRIELKFSLHTHFDDGLLIHERKWVIDFCPLEEEKKAVWRVQKREEKVAVAGCSAVSIELTIIFYNGLSRMKGEEKWREKQQKAAAFRNVVKLLVI